MENEYKIENLIKIIVIVILIIAIFYGLTIIITKNKKQSISDETKENVDIQYDEILIGSIYNQKETEYYVLVELESDYLTLSSSINNYKKKENALKMYTCNLNNGFNKQYFGEVSNFTNKYPTFSKSTLLKIVNKQIVEYIEGTDDIQKKLG